jgi:rhodanese-related sulfurtransferase
MAVSAGLAAAVNAARPTGRIPWVESWSNRVEIQALSLGIRVVKLDHVRSLVEEGLAFVFDARPPDAFAEGHLPLALSLPSTDVEETFALQYAPMLIPEQEIIVYCSGQLCDESLTVSRFLMDQGFTNVVLFADGFDAWAGAGLPTEEGL